MATPSLVGTSVYTPPAGSGGGVTTRTVNVPSGVQDGDLITVFISKAGSSTNASVSGLTLTGLTPVTQSGQSTSVFYKENAAAADAGATLTVTTTTALRVGVIVAVWRGIPASSVLDVYTTAQVASGTNATAPTATSTAASFRVDFVAGAGNNASVSYTAAAGMTKAAEIIDTFNAGDAFGAVFYNLTPAAAGTVWGANVYVGTAASISTSYTILIKQRLGANTVYPNAEIANNGGWTAFGGAASNVAAIADALDTTGLTTPNNAIATQYYETKLDEINAGDVTLTVRADRGTATSGTQTIVLVQGTTTIATWTDTLTASPATYTHTTTSTQTATITNRNDLRVRYSQALS